MGVPAGPVTLLFTDVEASVRLWEADREAMAEASARHNRLVREQVESAGGRVFKTVGEAFRVLFADPSAALASAVAVQRALGTESWPPGSLIRVRMALHAGAGVERDGDYVGPVANRVAGLLAVAHGGQVLVSGAAYELLAGRLPAGIGLRDLGEHQLKDLDWAERVFQVTGPGLAEKFGPLRSLDNPALRHNLPAQPTRFIGRTAELAELRVLVAGGPRLVTITGPGGIGKSRLALQVAADALDGTGDGVWLAELAPVADPELVARTVAAVLGVREEPGRPILDTLVDAVGDRYLLVVLDNAEHVLGSAAKLADTWLRSCPRASLLVTSREPLGISGEHVFRVPPLPVPPADLADPGELAGFESVQLFTEHAAMRRQSFSLDEGNAAAVAAVCARLDGIPLALELAAARLGSLSVQEISSRLDQRLRLLTGGSRTALPRHQTLRAMIDWSYDLLNPDERLALDQLSVFAGGWTLTAAEAVTARGGIADWQVLEHLSALVDKSLVQADETRGSVRYRLLETVRHYAAERLALRAGAELGKTRSAHRDHYLALVETAATYLRGPDEAGWLDRLEAEFDNIRAALAFSVTDPGSTEHGLRLAAGLRTFVFSRGHSGEVIEALGALLGRLDARQPTRYLARALITNCKLLTHFDRSPNIPSMAEEAITIARGLGDDALAADALAALNWFSFLQGDLSAALAGADEAVSLARAAEDPTLLVVALGHRAVFKAETGDLDASIADYQEVLSLARSSGDNYTLVVTLVNLGVDQIVAGEFPAALAYLQDALKVAHAHGYQHLSAAAEMNLGFAYLMNGDAASARRLLVGVLDRARATSEMTWVHNALLGLALAAGVDGAPVVAATLHGAADHQYEEAGQAFDAKESKMRAGDHARLRDALGKAAFDAAYQRGRTLSRADAVALAIAADQPDPADAPAITVGRATADECAGLLSAREREIIALLAGGASDAQIARHLYLSVNTVRSHLERIRDKTGARRRTELVRYSIQVGIDPVAPRPESRSSLARDLPYSGGRAAGLGGGGAGGTGGGVLLGEPAQRGEEGVAEHAADDDAFEPGVEGGPVQDGL
jgi:predicted ATPase/class 3 adenylate cyclase/DNA-binding CsgD family transcriptional regulator